MGTLDNIKMLVKHLPERDVKYANKFIEKRQFEDLRDLVDSAIIIVDKNLASQNPKEEYKKINTEKLKQLQAEVYMYCSYLDISDFDNSEEEEFLDFDEEDLY